MNPADHDPASTTPPIVSLAAEAAFARLLLRQRRRREELLGAHHFADPAWDMMLDLFAARVDGRPIAASSLVIAAGVPQSTALRRIHEMVEAGDLIACADPTTEGVRSSRSQKNLFERVAQLITEWRCAACL